MAYKRQISPNSMGALRLTRKVGDYEPVRTNNYRCRIYFKEGMFRDPNNKSTAIDKDHAQEVIDVTVASFQLPSISINPLSYDRGNSQVKYAGKATVGDVNLVINDFYFPEDGRSMLEAWRRKVYDMKTDAVYRANNYKAHITLLEYLPDGTLVRTYDMYGCWPKSVNPAQYNDQAGKQTATAQISVDYMYESDPIMEGDSAILFDEWKEDSDKSKGY